MAVVVKFPGRRAQLAPRWGGAKRRDRRFGASLIAVFIWAAIAAFAAGFFEYSEGRLGWLTSYFSPQPETPVSGDSLQASFSLCYGPIRVNCVVDGDTFWFRGTKIRIADIDTPELSPPRCAHEAQLGEAAKHRLLALLNAGRFSLASADRDTDRYGRKLRTVSRDGRSLGDALIDEGLARHWEGSRRSWCG